MMTSTLHFKSIATILIAWHAIASPLAAEVSSRLSSRFLARGEQALLEVAVVGHKPTRMPQIDPVRGVEIKPTGRGPQTQLLPGRRIEHVFEFMVSSYETGEHTIPAITIQAGGQSFTTEPLQLSVFDTAELKWSQNTVGNTTFRYASTFRVMDSTPYLGESIPVEIKLFVPRDIFVVDWGIPDFERDGVTAWRFQPSEMRSQINLLGMPYVSVAYPSVLTPTREGRIGIGPAEIRLVTTQVVMDGILRRVSVPTQLQVPRLDLESLPLPGNAPTGFKNAVGKFRIDVQTPNTEVSEGDPISLDIKVSGSGNLDTLEPPAPANSLGWKLYEATRQVRGDERRHLDGSVVFQQFIRPLELKSSIPSFRLVYFNPATKSYESAETEAIPLQMTPATQTTTQPVGPPPSAATPVEEMADILGLIPNAKTSPTTDPATRAWWLHAIGSALALLLVAGILRKRFGNRFHKDPEKTARKSQLDELSTKLDDDQQFLMAAGHYVERWHNENDSEEIREIIQQRDLHCFRKDEDPHGILGKERKQAMLSALRRALPLLVAAIVIIAPGSKLMAQTPAEAASAAYHEARYDDAIQSWLASAPYDQLSADTLYHIGNACYRAGSPGHAALYYRRALTRDPGHHESRQNLRFIERKYGALTVQRPDYQYALAKLPLADWQSLTWAGLWIIVLSILVFPATRPHARLRIAAVIGLICGPMALSAGILGWHYFPDDATFARISDQAVIVSEGVTVHTEASRTSAEVIQPPPGSLCEVLHETGQWSYVSFASTTRGWVLTQSIRMITPDQSPAAPEIRKPRAEDNNA